MNRAEGKQLKRGDRVLAWVYANAFSYDNDREEFKILTIINNDNSHTIKVEELESDLNMVDYKRIKMLIKPEDPHDY